MYNKGTPGQISLSDVVNLRSVGPDDILIESPELLFGGSFSREGDDLILEGLDSNRLHQKLVVEDYFSNEQVGLVAPNGAGLGFNTVKSLAGSDAPGQYAAAGNAAAGLSKIGEVIKLEGTANSKQVNGVENSLAVGDPVYQGDVITTGADTKLGITFIDDTVFSMSDNATMVLDELVYKGPGDSENSMVMNLVQGTFVFVTGEVAPSGNMQVETPIATMGIRGTTPKVTVDTNLGVGEFSILPDPGTGNVGSYVLIDKNTGAIIGRVESTEFKWVLTSLTGEAVEIGKSGLDLLEDQAALDEIRDLVSRSFGDRTELDGTNSFGQIGFDSLAAGNETAGGLDGVDDNGGQPVIGDGGQGEPGDAPIAGDDAFSNGEDPVLIGEDVIVGTGGGPDFDPDGFDVFITQVNGVDLVFEGGIATVLLPSGAILVVARTGGITYDPNDAYDFLGLNDVDVDSFQYTIEDREGFTDTATVTITLTGSNDQPEITNTALTMHSDAFTEGADTGNTGTTRTAIGNVSFTDIDASDTHTSSVGEPIVTWTQDGGGTQFLGPIGNIAIVLTETAADPSPVLEFAPDGSLISRPPPITGDVGWTFTVQENELDFLAEGETLELVYTITITDDSGVGAGGGSDEPQSVTQDIVITITGTNDVPQIQAGVVTGTIADINEDANVPPQNDAGLQTTTGSIDFTDADLTDRPVATEETVSLELIAQDGVTPIPLTAAQITAIENAFSISPEGISGANTNNGTINWTYSIAESDLDFLGAGEVVTATFLITITDDEGATATQTVIITILGADDDAPVITPVVVSGTITDVAEDSIVPPTANAGPLEATGSITFADVDLTDRPTASEATTSVTWLAADGLTEIILSASQLAAFEAAFSISPDGVSGANTNDGTIDWTYLIQESDVDFLAAGETVTAIFTITVTDDEGNTDTQDITITITGSNDTPFISAATDVSETLAETDAGLMTTGSFDVSDVDTSDVVSITGVTVAVSGNTADPAYPGDAALDAMFTPQLGAIVASGVNSGTVNWTFDSGTEAFDYLAAGESLTAVYTVTLDDGNGGTVTQDVTVTITGTNDAPTIIGEPDPAAVSEGDTGVLSNVSFLLADFFTGSDPDSGETPTVDETSIVITPNALSDTNNFSSLAIFGAGNSTAIVTDTANFDFLAAGEQAVFDVSYDIVSGVDRVTETFTITITGENDAPVATAGSNATASAGGGAVQIEPAFSAFDIDTAVLASATISISSGFILGEDVLNFAGTGGISGNYDAANGVLTLTGPGTVSEFVSAIQSITFQNTGSNPLNTVRTISYLLNDGIDNSVAVTSTVTVTGGVSSILVDDFGVGYTVSGDVVDVSIFETQGQKGGHVAGNNETQVVDLMDYGGFLSDDAIVGLVEPVDLGGYISSGETLEPLQPENAGGYLIDAEPVGFLDLVDIGGYGTVESGVGSIDLMDRGGYVAGGGVTEALGLKDNGGYAPGDPVVSPITPVDGGGYLSETEKTDTLELVEKGGYRSDETAVNTLDLLDVGGYVSDGEVLEMLDLVDKGGYVQGADGITGTIDLLDNGGYVSGGESTETLGLFDDGGYVANGQATEAIELVNQGGYVGSSADVSESLTVQAQMNVVG